MNDDHSARPTAVPTRAVWQRPTVRRIDPRAAENMPNPALGDGNGTFGS